MWKKDKRIFLQIKYMCDIIFLKIVYSNDLTERNIMNNNLEIVKLYYNNKDKYYANREEFYEANPTFNWNYYVDFYDLRKYGYTGELDAIMHFIRYGIELNIFNQDAAFLKATNVKHNIDSQYVVTGQKILLVSHDLNLTGAPLVLQELCDIFSQQSSNKIDILNLGELQDNLQMNGQILNDKNIDLLFYDVIIFNTISEKIIAYLESINYTYLNNTILWIHEIKDSYFVELSKHNFKFAICLADSEIVKDKLIKYCPNICKMYKVLKLVNTRPLEMKTYKDYNLLKIGN